jgi:hypothetical protein
MNIRLLLLGMPVAVVLGATPAVVELSEGDPNAPTPVLVANQFIPRGTSGNYIQTHRMSMETTLPRGEVESGAIRYADLRGRMTTADIYPGRQLTAKEFWPPAG